MTGCFSTASVSVQVSDLVVSYSWKVLVRLRQQSMG
jgi:hypothetical protein